MSDFMIDEEIIADFEYIQNLCEMLSEFTHSKFENPMPIEEIERWEKENDTTLPQQYKSWLALTSCARIAGGYYDFFLPEIGCFEEDNDVVIAASIIGDGEELLISRSTGKVFSCFEGEVTEHDSFDDFLGSVMISLEEQASEYLGDSWEEIYDEKFGD